MLCNMTKLGALVISAVVAFVLSADAQINLVSDAITFRTNTSADYAKTTNHYGYLVVTGATKGLSAYGTQATGLGGTCYGVRGYATGPNCSNYAVYGSASGTGTTINYGIYGYAPRTAYSYAGYFNGYTWCTDAIWSGSDAALKTSVVPLQSTMSQIMQLQPKTYYFDTTAHPNLNLPTRKQYGLLAQDLQTVFPEMVMDFPEPDTASNPTKAPTTFKAVNYTQLIAVLIAGMQEQQKQINALQAQLGMK